MTSMQIHTEPMGTVKESMVWYLAQCKPNAERLACLNLKNQKFTVFLPFQKATKRLPNTFQTALTPLFPGYIFVEIDTAKGEWSKINNTRGVARLVRFGYYPSPVPTSVMQSLFASCNKEHIFDPENTLKVGDEVKVIRGPFSGFASKIAAACADKRSFILLEVMGQTSSIRIPHDHLLKKK